MVFLVLLVTAFNGLPAILTPIMVINHENLTLTIYKWDSVVGDLIPGARFHIWAAVNSSLEDTLKDLDIHTGSANGQTHQGERLKDSNWMLENTDVNLRGTDNIAQP